MPGKRKPVKRLFAASLLVVVCFCSFSNAGIRGPGKYSGVVIFDRWGGCILFSGIYLMYVSEAIKEQLRPYEGKAIQVYASQVFQPTNPGDGLIRRIDEIGPALRMNEWYKWFTIDGIKLDAQPVSVDEFHAVLSLVITNNGARTAHIDGSQIGIAVLTKRIPQSTAMFSDGPSFAVITRAEVLRSMGPWGIGVGDHQVNSYSFVVDDIDKFPRVFDLGPGESKMTKLTFSLPKGHYQFWAGYGGGVHDGVLIVSNPVSIDLGEPSEGK